MKKVLVAMSGGVDSSVSAYLLRKQGYEVVGATMLMWDGQSDKVVEDAKEVCNILGLTHVVIDFRKQFRQEVISYYTSEYKAGRTPNPCVRCNKQIKFGLFLEKAMTMGFDYIATGHYAQIAQQNGNFLLMRGKDLKKDQSYFLYNLNQDILSKVIFPIGGLLKDDVRKIACDAKLLVADKKESQDVCFQYKMNADFGDIVDKTRNVLGQHNGLCNYTIGQREGIRISAKKPLYVVGIDTDNNRLIVGDKEELMNKEMYANSVNFINDVVGNNIRVDAKIRYGATATLANVSTLEGNRAKVVFDIPVMAVTKGQSVVFYQDDNVIGGGIIE